ncbi:MAG: hypothetical protein ACFFDP_11975 [Promethearchaeota archaeon]
MPKYELGELEITDHESETLTGAFGLEEERFKEILDIAEEAWQTEETVSESVELLAKKLKGSELVVGLLVLGRIWKEEDDKFEEEKDTD